MKTQRTAFTLMEMLVVIALLGTLMGISAAGMRAADNMARETRTRSTITKLNRFVMEKYASYQYRRVGEPGDSAATRLTRLRQLQVWEMPDHWSEVNSSYSPYRIVSAASNKYQHDASIQSAELLYQIVIGMPEADSAFNGLEVADTDGNGLNEFVDGWGTPIQFVRWPAGHTNENYGAISKIQNGTDPDPFDFTRSGDGYAVFPLIFSCGPDRSKGIITSVNSTKPWGVATCGAPGEGGSSGDSAKETSMYYDNITNHNL